MAIKTIRNHKPKIIITFMLLSGFFMIKRQMDESKRERKQYFYNYSGELSGELSFEGKLYTLDAGFVTYEFENESCTEALHVFTSTDKITKQKKTNRFTIIKADGRKVSCQ
ncbi:MAG: putative Fe-S cluster-containing protein [Saprospiraceae bacterium]|jgi:uncharacterized Fe-S cluster-containing protein|tara:strand:- start:1338 stop:1670 length:333 start_codon:yes stop_codon:yes gene_type:complete